MDRILLKKGTVLVHTEDDENPTVQAKFDIDVLIEGNTIIQIGKNIPHNSDTQVIDCSKKIVSPGFISTHSHLWQSQLKGRHVNDTLFDYFPKGNFMSHAYEPVDTYWGQLVGGLEAVNAGTTTVLDHAHGCPTKDHVGAALQATLDSGVRCVWAFADPIRFERWDENECRPSMEIWSEEATRMIAQFAQKHNSASADSRLEIGLGFDSWFLPPQMIERIITDATHGGVKTLTSHIGLNVVQAIPAPLTYLKKQAPFMFRPRDGTKKPRLDNFVISHATNIHKSEFEVLLSDPAGFPLNTSISTTPETECQMAMCRSVAFTPTETTGVPIHRVSLGIDCHAAASSFMPHAGRLGLQNARILHNEVLAADDGKFPQSLPGDSGSQLFNSFTINGAKALGLDHDDGGIGRIRIGRKADIVVFDATDSINMGIVTDLDPIIAVTRFSELSDVEIVIVDGVVRKQGKKLLPVDTSSAQEGWMQGKKEMSWTEIRCELAKSYERLYERMKQLNIEKARETLTKLFHIDTTKFVEVH